jgi:hypothetical protein
VRGLAAKPSYLSLLFRVHHGKAAALLRGHFLPAVFFSV